MQIEEYFDFQRPDDIRVKGTRIGIETILYDFIHRSRTPEEIAQSYPSLTLEQVYATILYYLHNQATVSNYLADWLEWSHQQRKAQELNPSPAVLRLRKLKAERTVFKYLHEVPRKIKLIWRDSQRTNSNSQRCCIERSKHINRSDYPFVRATGFSRKRPAKNRFPLGIIIQWHQLKEPTSKFG